MNIVELAMLKKMAGGSNLRVATDEQILSWLNKEDIVTPTASASGEIYTTNNNEIYIL